MINGPSKVVLCGRIFLENTTEIEILEEAQKLAKKEGESVAALLALWVTSRFSFWC